MRRVSRFKVATHLISLLPLAALLWAAWREQLGPDPVGEATRRAGRYALIWLFLSLLPTTVRNVTGWAGLLRVRRVLGLYAFLYAAVHLLIYVGVDFAFALGLLIQEISRSPFILVGLAAFVILIALAITSTNGWVRRLGRYWRRLHRLAYLAAALVVVHYAWNYKELRSTPLFAGATLALLLVLRLPPVVRLFARMRGCELGIRN
jgi:sulfoxide reductase heme-binding subunit YedZ